MANARPNFATQLQNINAEDLQYLEMELNFSDLVSLAFLLFAEERPNAEYVLQKLLVISQMGNFGACDLLCKYAASNASNWRVYLLEALCIIGNKRVLRKLGFDWQELCEHFLPHVTELSVHIHPLLKALYKVCEYLTPLQTSQMVLDINEQLKQPDESLSKGQKNAKFVQRVRQMQEEHRKQKRIEDKYSAEASASMLDTYFQTDELIQQALTEAPKDKTFDELLNVLKVDKPNNAVQSDTESDEDGEEEEEEFEDDEMLEEEQQDDEALFSSDEETEQKMSTVQDIDFVETAVEQDIESESDAEDDETTKCLNKDPFAKHADYELTAEHLESVT